MVEIMHESAVHQDLRNLLKRSEILSPLHVEVTNLSYWYLNRSLLRPKRQMATITTFNEVNNRHEAYIYKMKVSDASGEIIPQRQFLSTFTSQLAALKCCLSEIHQRDRNPAEDPANLGLIDNSKILSTHFKITVVSSAFYRKSNAERLMLVYEELLSSMGASLSHSSNLATCCPRMRFCSTYGENTLQVITLIFQRLILTTVQYFEVANIPFLSLRKSSGLHHPGTHPLPVEAQAVPSAHHRALRRESHRRSVNAASHPCEECVSQETH